MTGGTVRVGFALLAGGRAERYGGRPKGLLRRPDGTTLAEHLLGAAAAAGLERRIVVTNDPDAYRPLGHALVRDLRPGCGPLGGIEAALEHFSGSCEGVLFLPCDLPGFSAREAAALRDAFAARKARLVVARTADFSWHPLCSVVHIGLRRAVGEALDRGARAVGRLWRDLGAEPVDFPDAAPFFNVNAPEDLEAWRRQEGIS